MQSLRPCTLTLVMLYLLRFASSGMAQQPLDSIPLSLIKTTDGNEFVGKITHQDSAFLTLNSKTLGEIKLPQTAIEKIVPIKNSQIVKGNYWFDNPHTTRYFFAPNGYGLRKGEAYYQNTWVLTNQVSVGLSDHVSIGAGVIPLFLFGGGPTMIWVTPKVSIPVQKDKINIGVGAFVGGVLGNAFFDESGGVGFGVVYSNLTLGTRERNGTFGVGYGYAGGEWSSSPTINMGFMSRIGRKTVFISENYLLGSGDGSVVILSAGIRFLGKKLAIDGGLFTFLTEDGDFEQFAWPWLSIHVPFGADGTGSKAKK